MAPFKGALIGCGFFARNHLHAWRGLEEAELVAVCDRDRDRDYDRRDRRDWDERERERERERAGRARPRATIRTEYGDVMDQ